jgi:hypothetical protein
MAATTLADPRRRTLVIVGGVAALFLLLAGGAVLQQSNLLAPKFEPRPAFPGLVSTVNTLGEITVSSKDGTFHVRQVQGKWVIPERESFPAELAIVRATATGLADLQLVEPKTSRADWMPLLGLAAPDKGGDGMMVTLKDTSGKTLADLIVGHAQGAPDITGRATLYVRRPNEEQSWLARGFFTAKPLLSDWLDRAVVPIMRDRVKGATVDPATGPTYTMVRDSKDQPDFRVLDLPRGRELSFPGSPDGVAGAITGFNFDDVAKANPADFENAPSSVTNTFDGLEITVKVAAKGMEHWATVSAKANNPMVQKEADAINARANGWAFKLPEMNVTQLVSPLETLLRPAGEKAGPTTLTPAQ